jgi:hypothetical protein
MRESARPEADLHRPVSSTQRNATATSRATPSQLQLRDPTTSTDRATIASKRPAYGSAGGTHCSRWEDLVGMVEGTLARPRQSGPAAISSFPPRHNWIADGNLRAVAVGVFPREFTIWLSRGSPY